MTPVALLYRFPKTFSLLYLTFLRFFRQIKCLLGGFKEKQIPSI